MSDNSRGDAAAGRRAAILAAAVDVCAREGFGGATLREIADEAGIKKGLLTYYFPTKDELVFEVILRLHQRFALEADEWIGDDDAEPDVRLQRWLLGHATLVCRVVDEVRVAHECTRHLSPVHRRDIEGMRRRYEERLGELVDESRATAPLADLPTPSLVRTALGVLDGTYQWLDPAESPSDLTDIAAVVADRALASMSSTVGDQATDSAPTASHG